MKLFKKLSIMLVCALCAVGICASVAACGGESVAEGTYVFYVYQDDGSTPVEGVILQVCNGDTCYLPITTDSNGRAEIDLSAYTIGENLCVHFYNGTDDLPEGYTYPSGSQTILTYQHAWYVTSQITTLKLIKA